MVATLRALALGVLTLAITLHVIGFLTHDWVAAKLDSRDIEYIISASGVDSQVPKGASDGAGMDISMGLWKGCMNMKFGRMAPRMPWFSSREICNKAKGLPDWWKAVQALGILSLITASVGVATAIYSFIGDSKGDRTRLLPHFMATICLQAGVLLLIAVVVYGAEFSKAMDQQLIALFGMDPSTRLLMENLKQYMSLGYSFALEVVSGVLMVLVSLLVALPVFRGEEFLIGGPHNLAV